MTATAAVSPRTRRIVALAWLIVFVPFVLTVINGGPAGGLVDHGAYHLAYVGVIALAATVLWRWRDLSPHRGVRRLITAALVLQAIAVVGHVGEAISTTMDGSYEEDGIVLSGNETLHTAFANMTVPSLVGSMLLLLWLTVDEARRTRSRPSTV